MATILIVDDRPVNSEYLVTLLGYGGHRLLQASDGAEGLATARAEHLDLVIADILMPTMDGYEFVRQLRKDPAIAATPVIFYTAHYLEREARALAQACGVSHVLTKPAEPDVVLRTVDAALGVSPPPAAPTSAVEFDREHLRLLTDKLSQKAENLRRANERLTALVDLGLELGSERDPRQLLQTFCHAAREIIGAKYAIAGILDGDGQRLRYSFTSGMDAETATCLGSPDPRRGGAAIVLSEVRCVRLDNPGADPTAIDFPSSYPPIHSWLGAPIISPGRAYGWLGLFDKVGTEAFSDEDERLASVLAAQVGRIYESGSLYADMRHHAAKLELEVAERKRAEQALRESEAQSRLLLDSTAEAIYGIDMHGRCTFCNPACLRLLGYAEGHQLLGKHMHALIHHTRVDGTPYPEGECRIFRAFRAGEGSHVEDEVLWRADGSSFPAEYWSYPIRHQGQIVGSVVTFLDITDKRLAQETQRKLAAERDLLLRQLQLQVERMPLAYVLFDADFRVIDWNRAAENIFGYSKEEVLGMGPPFERILPPAAWSSGQEILRRMRAGDMSAHAVNENLTKDGRTITCQWYNTPLLADNGRFAGMLGLAQDITARKQMEDQVRQAQQRLQHVVVSSPAVLYTLEGEGENLRLTWISENVLEMLGCAAKECFQPNWWQERVYPEDLNRVWAEIQGVLFTQDRLADEYRFRHEDGNYRWVRSEMRLLRDAAGNPLEIVGSWSDITQRKQLEEQFRQAQKMEAVGRLAGGVAHDFNNLLTIINGYGEIVLGGLPHGDPNRELIKEIVAAGGRAAGLTRQLLAFSRKAILEPRILDLRVVVADVDKMLRRILGEDIQLTVITDPELGAVKADPGQIEQVLLNLVVNARDAMPQGGPLTIEVRNTELDETYVRTHAETKPGPYTLLAVSDTGCGMDQATMTRIFEPFFSTKGEKGTGLGLATVHGIVKQSGGHVAVYSEVGRGTVFKVYLPRLEVRPPSGKSPTDLAALARGTETVLVVEDEDGVRALTGHVLRNCGYTVLEARDGPRALQLAEQHSGRIDLVVTDVVMPRMSGREVAERLAGSHPSVKVLFLSGYTDDAVVRHGILEAEVAFLQKPFSPASLAAKVREVLDR